MNNRAKISKQTVNATHAPARGEVRIWDTKISGFCLRVYPSGRKVYALKYRRNGVQGWLKIGRHGDITPDEARADALAAKVLADRGQDPALALREAQDPIKVGALIDLYLKDGPASKPSKRASSWATDKANLDRHVRPQIGKVTVAALTRKHVTDMLKAVTDGATAADTKTGKRGRSIVKGGAGAAGRTLTTTRAMFNWAIKHGHLSGENPASRITLAARPAKERFLSSDEAIGLLEALDRLEATAKITVHQAAIFRLLLLTGARRNEIAALRWSEVDLDRSRIVLPPERSKAGGASGERRIALNTMAAQILQGLPRKGPWVFPAAKGGSGHTTATPKVWRTKVQPAAALAGVRVHDLRHTFASFALADGASIPAIGKALGHASSRSTERYAHLSGDALLELSERVGSRLARSTTTPAAPIFEEDA